MAAADQEALLYVQQNVSELRKLGKEWGLSQSDINRCIQRALAEKVDKPSESNKRLLNTKFEARKTWSKCRVVLVGFFCMLGVIMQITSMVTAVMMYQANSIWPSRFLLPHAYRIMRVVRLAGVPLHDSRTFDQFYTSECILDNPLFATPPQNCDDCKNMKSVKELKIKSSTVKIHLLAYPLMHRGIQTPVHLETIQEIAQQHKTSLMAQPINCNANWARYASDFDQDDLKEKILQEDKFSCEWESKDRMFLSQIFRKHFPRPSVLPTEMEVTLQKHLYIDGKGSATRVLPKSQMGGYCWYAQGSGSRVIKFKPYKECEDTCKSFQVTVNEGDIVTYPSERWHVELEEGGESISVGFSGFMLP